MKKLEAAAFMDSTEKDSFSLFWGGTLFHFWASNPYLRQALWQGLWTGTLWKQPEAQLAGVKAYKLFASLFWIDAQDFHPAVVCESQGLGVFELARCRDEEERDSGTWPKLANRLRQRRRDLRRLAAAGEEEEDEEEEEEGEARGGLGCGDLRLASGVSLLGWGFTKVVARAALAGGGEVALKSVHGSGREVRQCVERYGEPAGCRRLAAYKLLKEVRLLQLLRHPGIVQLHGQCYDNSGDAEIRVTAMLELGAPLEMIQLLQTPWEERFKICLSLVKLLFYLAHSPLGSIVLLDFQPRQFVMVDGNLKVTDMDDASTEELSCKEDNDCTLDFPTKSFPLKCSAVGKCEGINEKKNLFNAYRYFFTYLLPHSAPPALRPFLSDILNATGDLRYGINETLQAFEKVLHLYKSGLYLQKRPLLLKDYISLKGFRTVEGEDYKCWPSYSHLGCLLSVHGAEEAAAICNSQSQCQSFIITQQRTWTGRPLASFQSSLADLVPDANAVVYIKRSASSGKRL
ncbi:PREDICTED: extracellular tyrosine-protein kinase PKDCC-like [Calidris pugnax]|uniref:extracellular tyrosine-protein kinase PKDCC-like n=1 Tax=Calidris pugnax TaxID=198806 RepID=UPI00071D9086|nr:PREDICTED: extracellular tyrosine-protein kinase PKDCC-like [Calidris pugnax]